MKKYDDASWHYEGEYPKNLPNENAGIFIGMFLAWCVENDFVSEEILEEEKEVVDKIKAHEITGSVLLWKLDGKLISEDLNEEGNSFALSYYEDNSKFAKTYGDYVTDFCEVFNSKAEQSGLEYESLYHVEDTLENYLLIKNLIDIRFKQWIEFV
ncbi:MAG: hypothetical protein ACK5MV_09150 [Aminipila sp.]